MKNKREIIGIFLICAVMVSLAEMLWLGWVGVTLDGWFTEQRRGLYERDGTV